MTTTTNDERRLIPSPELPREEIDAWVRQQGYRLHQSQLRTHHEYRALVWRSANGGELVLVENHVLGERFVIVRGAEPAGIDTALRAQSRDALLAAAQSATGRAALPPLRRLCLLEANAPSQELRALSVREARNDDVQVRRSLLSAVMLSWQRAEDRSWFLEMARAGERDERLAAIYARIPADG